MSTPTPPKSTPLEHFRVQLKSLIFAASGSLDVGEIVGELERAKLETFRDDPGSNRGGGDYQPAKPV